MMDLGMIHGRFQPFHNGHFDYLKRALRLASRLVIGITNPDPDSAIEVSFDSHRQLGDANPFSYYLRLQMIQSSILAEDELAARYRDIAIVPFPVTRPAHWKYYIPMYHVTQLVSVLEPWDEEKARLFRSQGFPVRTLRGRRIASGTEIRELIRGGDSRWIDKVPIGTRDTLVSWLEKATMRLKYDNELGQ